MFQRVAVLLAGLVWAGLLFLCTGWLTFPGQKLSDRTSYEVHERSRRAYTLEMGPISPWWLGVKAADVKVFGRKDRKGEMPLLAYATDARVSVGPLGLLARAPSLSGSVTLGDAGTLYYDVDTMNDGGALSVSRVDLSSEGFPLAELIPLIPSAEMDGTGALDIAITLDAAAGLSKANGEIELRGKALELIEPVIADFPLGRNVVISNLDLDLDTKDGVAKVRRGRIQSDVADIEVSGEIQLSDLPMNSEVDLRFEIELDASMAMLATAFKKAEDNGKLIFTCQGRLSALERACSAGEKSAKSSSRARPRSGRARPRPSTRASRDKTDPKGSAAKPERLSLSKEEREERRRELKERLAKRREERLIGAKGVLSEEEEEDVGDEEEVLPEDELGLDEDEEEDILEDDEEVIEDE